MKRIARFWENTTNLRAFEEYRTEIARVNLRTLRQVSLIGMIGGAVLTVVSLPPLRLLSMLWGYVAIAGLFAAVYALTKTALRTHPRAILPVYYALAVLLLGLGILMGTRYGSDTNATTFVMLLMVLPMFVIDKPYRVCFVFGGMCAAFCVTAAHFKVGRLLSLDIANSVVFYFLSIVLSWQTTQVKVNDIIIKRELRQQRDIDKLTQLNNRGAFERVIAKYMGESDQGAVLLIMDVDRFKLVNDRLGHAAGDRVLQKVGEYLKETFRKSDLVSRLGGDEFVAFLPAVDDLDAVKGKVNALIERIKQTQLDPEGVCTIGASVGLARYPEDGRTFDELYKHADEALYCAKERGRGQLAVCGEPPEGGTTE